MEPSGEERMETESIGEFARAMRRASAATAEGSSRERPPGNRLDLSQENLKNGLGQLVLTLVKLLHELLERQAIRRIEAGSLGLVESEKLGLALMRQAQEINRLREEFGLEEEDLNLDLGPLGRLF